MQAGTQIKLNQSWQKKFWLWRALIWILSFLIAWIILHRILFPLAGFTFSFGSPNSNKNSVTNVRLDDQQEINQPNLTLKNGNLFFDTALTGNYSEIKIDFNLNSKTANKPSGEIKIRKSFQAFFYPLGESLDFKDGSLLKNESDYYLVSAGALRKFSSPETAIQMGFFPEAFQMIDPASLGLNPLGKEITLDSPYPQSSIFKIDDEFYQLTKPETLQKFVSEQAYLTQYSSNQAIEKNSDFLKNYSISQDYLGFADGTLLAAGISVYIVSDNKVLPVNNPVTFESMGYQWDEILQASSEEIGIYEKASLFKIDSPHPDGTIFYAQDSQKYYYIKNKERHEIPNKTILDSYLRIAPVTVQQESLEKSIECEIHSHIRELGFFHCQASINPIENFTGNDYQFSFPIENSIQLDQLDIEFTQIANKENLLKSLAALKNRVFNNYSLQ